MRRFDVICTRAMLVISLGMLGCDDGPTPEDAGLDAAADADADGDGDGDVDGDGDGDGDADADGDGDGDTDADSDGDTDADSDGDSDADADLDSEVDGDDETAPICEFPTPEIGGTVETDALAEAPARCEQADHSWLDVDELGDVVTIGDETEYPAFLLQALLDAEGVIVGRELEHDTAIRVVSYMTQDRGALVEATTLMAYPTDLEPGDELDTILFLHGTSGFTDACAPSLEMETGALMAVFAAMGYMVTAPDYIGIRAVGEPTGFLHPYLVGQATAIASLDAVRALGELSGAETHGSCPRPRVVAFGGSQGGHAALWVDRLAPYYAPELELVGVVATVPPSDLVTHTENALVNLVNATGNAIAVLTTAGQWYGFEDRLSEVFRPPLDTTLPGIFAATCDPDDEIPDYTATSEIFQPMLIEAATNGQLGELSPWGCIFAENGLTTTSVNRLIPADPTYGILFVLGELDELVDPAIERAAFDTLCTQGLSLQYLECAGAEHTDATYWAIPEIIDFIDARVGGDAMDAESMCVRTAAQRCSGTPE